MLLRQLGAGEPLKNTRSQTQINKTAAALTPTNEKGKKSGGSGRREWR